MERVTEIYTHEEENSTRKIMKNEESSFMHRHQMDKHNGAPVEFEIKVVRSCKDPLSRQVSEAVLIKSHTGEILNSKAEFYQPPLVRIRSEIIRGLED